MPGLNWGVIQDGGAFESLMHAILYAERPGTILFGRHGQDAGQDARSADGTVVYQAKFRQGFVMNRAVDLALEELEKIKTYRLPDHPNYRHWQSVRNWILVANFSINPNDQTKWQNRVLPVFQQEGLVADYWDLEVLEGKLEQHPEVRDVFFGGENRVLVGLKETHDLLLAECIGSSSLNSPMIGRNDELNLIKAFAASSDKKILPIIGPGGIGKSRLLYEGLISLAQEGWRVYWALSSEMARSTQWYRLLNGTQRTCVAIDDPDAADLLRRVIDQLAAVERQSWKVIVACRSERSNTLKRFLGNKWVADVMKLGPLSEQHAKELLRANLVMPQEDTFLHQVSRHMGNIPGWVCLFAELANRGALPELYLNADDIAAAYVSSCLESLRESLREQGHKLIRWLSLWGTLKVEAWGTEQAELRFLDSQGMSYETVRDLLKELVGTSIVRNWGIGKRFYAIEPLIIRQHILSNWLLSVNEGVYEVSYEGTMLLSQLVRGDIPAVDSALKTLSHLARSRLDEPEAIVFLEPLFNAMMSIAQDGNLLDQYRVLDFVEKAGATDPENALNVLVTIRQNIKESIDVDIPPWGRKPLAHESLVSNLPWVLFQITDSISDLNIARRYINEFRHLVALEDAGNLHARSGSGARELLKRILCGSKNSQIYSQTAYEFAIAELTVPESWPFVSLLAECILNPIREAMGWVANWTITITRRAFLPESLEWNLSMDLRRLIFDVLRVDTLCAVRAGYWHVLAESHHEFHRALLHGSVRDAVAATQYRSVLIRDLNNCVEILRSPPIVLSVEEMTRAREIWEWYLEYGSNDDPVDLARQCELIYNSMSTWRFQYLFSFATDEELAAETERIVKLLREAPGPELFTEFFDEAKLYLNAARQGQQDMADSLRISNLAKACADLLSLEDTASPNALTTFVLTVLSQPEPGNPLAWSFSVSVCRQYLLGIKRTDEDAVAYHLGRLLDATVAKDRMLWKMYSNVHPTSTGALTRTELDFVLSHEDDFSGREYFVLLGAFSAVNALEVQTRLRNHLDSLRDDPNEASQCMACFIEALYITALRYHWPPIQLPVAWIINMIIDFRLDGFLLSAHDLESMRDQAGFCLNMIQMVSLIRSRIELEELPRPSERFEIIPSNFKVDEWCNFDTTNQAEVNAFYDFCLLALGSGFTALYWMPKYIAQIDPSGQHVRTFVEQQLNDNPDLNSDALARLAYLASSYPDDSTAWATIAGPICIKTQYLPRKEREHVYFGLSRKETGVLTSMPGQVADYYVQARDKAVRLRDDEPYDSPLRGYREWALRCADEDLRREEGRAEEVADE